MDAQDVLLSSLVLNLAHEPAVIRMLETGAKAIREMEELLREAEQYRFLYFNCSYGL